MKRVNQPSQVVPLLDVGLSLSGIGLTGFVLLHLGLLASVLLGAQSMNSLASFLERFYLLQGGAPLLILLAIAHVFLAARKAPITYRERLALIQQIRRLGHFDTWSWGFQALSGAILLAIGSVHLLVILTDLPIQAAKSGERVFGIYLWFYLPFIFFVETHSSLGLYRIAVKWGLVPRRWAHRGLILASVAAITIGLAILSTLYVLGSKQ